VFENLGPALGLLREVRKLSQAEVARRARIGTSQLSKYESGKELPKLDSLEKVLNVYGVGADGLFTVVRVIDGWAATMGTERKQEAALLSLLPSTSFPEVDQTFGLLLADLLRLQRSMLEAILRTTVAAARSPHGDDRPEFGFSSRD
jgi:transcriptional regulator with XRE-family HTH domain